MWRLYGGRWNFFFIHFINIHLIIWDCRITEKNIEFSLLFKGKKSGCECNTQSIESTFKIEENNKNAWNFNFSKQISMRWYKPMQEKVTSSRAKSHHQQHALWFISSWYYSNSNNRIHRKRQHKININMLQLRQLLRCKHNSVWVCVCVWNARHKAM